MIKSIKNIVLFSLAILFVVSTSGINVFIHHCCAGDEQISVFVEEDCAGCLNKVEKPQCSCCTNHTHDEHINHACSSSNKSCNIADENHSFCNTTQQFFQISDDFVETAPETIPQPLQLAILLFEHQFSSINLEELTISPQYENGPPIGFQKDGLELIYHYNCLKIPAVSC